MLLLLGKSTKTSGPLAQTESTGMDMDVKQAIQNKARELLEKGEIDCFIGYEKGQLPFYSPPVFIDNPADVKWLVWDDFCTANLSKYLMNLPPAYNKIGLITKGCDSRGLMVLIQDNQIKRENMVIVGVSCPGMKDPSTARLKNDMNDVPTADKCVGCTFNVPVIYDYLFGEKTEQLSKDRFARVDEIEKYSIDEKYNFWQEHFTHCIRCYACRNICPACNCRSCYVDQQKANWHGKGAQMADNANYILTRTMHAAGRCIECGECERVCPQQVPLMTINKKLIREMQTNFNSGPAGLSQDSEQPLCSYSTDDPDEFM